MTTDYNTEACHTKHEEINRRIGEHDGMFARLFDKMEALNERAPKWCALWISLLSGALGGAVALLCVLLKVAFT